MTMDVSRLGIVVETEGIDKARKELDGGNGRGGLYGAADKAEKAVTKLTTSIGKLMTVNLSGSAMAWNSVLGQLSGTLQAINSSSKETAKVLEKLSSTMDDLSKTTDRASAANERKSRSGGVVTNTLKAMTTAALAYVSVNFATSIIKQADAWIMMEAKLKNATGSLNNARVAQAQMFDLAQRLRVPLEDTVKLYTRLAPAVQRLGKDSNYAKDMVEGISTALQLSGANGAEASSVMLQLSQSFSSGVLNGAEFNAVAENGSVLMRALEKYTGKTTYELKKMGSEGKLTMETVGKAIQAALPEWRKQFDSLPMTFEGAMLRLKNAWTKAVGELGQDTGFNKALSQALLSVEKLIPLVMTGLGSAFKAVMEWIERNKDKLEQIGESILLVIGQVWELSKAFGQISGDLLTVGKETSVWSLALTGVAFVVASISDGFRVMATMITLMGLAFGKLIVIPFQGWAMIISEIIRGFGEFVGLAETGLRAIGKFEAAERMAAFSRQIISVSDDIDNVNKDIDGFFKDNAKMAVGWTEAIGEGQSAILNLTKKLHDADDAAAQLASRKIDFGFGEMDEKGWNANKNHKTPVDSKAVKAAETATKHYESAIEGLNAKLEEQIELKDNLSKRGLDYDKINPALKEAIKLREHLNNLIATNGSQLEKNRTIAKLAIAETTAGLATENERTTERLRAEKAVTDKHATTIDNLRQEAEEVERQVASYGKAKGAVDALALSEAQRRLSMMEDTSEGQRGGGFEARLEALRAEVELRQRIADAAGQLGQKNAGKEFDKLFDARKAEKFAASLTEGFGKAGKALGLLANAADKYLARQAKISQGREILNKLDKGSAEFAKKNQQLMEEEAESRIATYADMAGAAKNFFEQGSKGYKAMEAAEKTFRAFQMAMQVKAFLQETGFLQAITSLFVATKTTEVAATAATVAPTVAANTAKQGSNAITALTSALAGPWPMNIAAFAMVAAMLAAIGVGVSGAGGGGSVDVAKQRQAAQGTGTVFGDDKAKSESISKSLELLSKNSDIALRYSSGMLSSLQNIEYSLTGATSGVIRTGSVTGRGFESSKFVPGKFSMESLLAGGPLLLGNAIGGKLGSFLTGASGFSGKTNLKDSGLLGANQSVRDILNGALKLQGYQDIQTTKKFLGITYSDKTKTELSNVDPSIALEFKNIISGMVNSLTDAASALGMSGDAVRAKLEAVNIDIGKISLKDLSSEEVQKQLEAVFSAIGDKLSAVALPNMARFQKAGEGLLETAVRVASGVEQANYALEKLGITAINFNQLTKTTGDVGAEIVRQSILMQESGAGIREIMQTLTGDASEIADTYKALRNARDSLVALHIANDISRDLIRAAGGLDSLQNALDSYQENYFSDAEKLKMKTDALSKEFSKLGLSMPSTKEGFRALVEQLSSTGATGQQLAAKVLLLADAFASLTDAQENMAGSVQDARDALSEAYERESNALKDTRDRFREFADSLHDFRTSLLTGDLSTLNVAAKYQVEKARFEEVLAKAKAGDEQAIGQFENVATSFLNASRAMNASNSVYTGDFARVLEATEMLEGYANGKATIAEQQLAALDKQVEGLITLNESVLTVAQAIANLTALLGGTSPVVPTGPNVSIPTPPPVGVQTAEAGTGSGSILSTLGEKIADVIKEVQGLREDQAAQTGALIESNYDANKMNASEISDSARENASYIKYTERTATQLA